VAGLGLAAAAGEAWWWRWWELGGAGAPEARLKTLASMDSRRACRVGEVSKKLVLASGGAETELERGEGVRLGVWGAAPRRHAPRAPMLVERAEGSLLGGLGLVGRRSVVRRGGVMSRTGALVMMLLLLLGDRCLGIRQRATPLGAGRRGWVSQVGSRGGRRGGVPRAERAS